MRCRSRLQPNRVVSNRATRIVTSHNQPKVDRINRWVQKLPKVPSDQSRVREGFGPKILDRFPESVQDGYLEMCVTSTLHIGEIGLQDWKSTDVQLDLLTRATPLIGVRPTERHVIQTQPHPVRAQALDLGRIASPIHVPIRDSPEVIVPSPRPPHPFISAHREGR